MKVYAENHYGAALLTELESGDEKTMLIQVDYDQEAILGKNWEEGIHVILDDYAEYFE